jgi:hypothetical protein
MTLLFNTHKFCTKNRIKCSRTKYYSYTLKRVFIRLAMISYICHSHFKGFFRTNILKVFCFWKSNIFWAADIRYCSYLTCFSKFSNSPQRLSPFATLLIRGSNRYGEFGKFWGYVNGISPEDTKLSHTCTRFLSLSTRKYLFLLKVVWI